MLKTLKALFRGTREDEAGRQDDRHRLKQALATLLHEVSRMDLDVRPEDLEAASKGLAELVGMPDEEARELLDEVAKRVHRLTSYHDAVSIINRSLSQEQKILLVEHMWRVAHADSELHPHEDHLVRKISDLLYVPHIQSMLARQRARGSSPASN